MLEFNKSEEDSLPPIGVSSSGVTKELSDDDNDTFMLAIHYESIKDVIYRLFRLSTKLRNPSTRLRSSKAQQYRILDGDVDLFEKYEHFDLDYVRSVFQQYRNGLSQDDPNAIESRAQSALLTEHYLVKRIARANVMRRRQFAYWKHHRLKLEQHTDLAVRASPQKEQARVLDNRASNIEMSLPNFAPPSISTATQLHPKLVDYEDVGSIISVSEYTPTSNFEADDVIFPQPPNVNQSEKFFECPYCFTTCARRTGKANAWK